MGHLGNGPGADHVATGSPFGRRAFARTLLDISDAVVEDFRRNSIYTYRRRYADSEQDERVLGGLFFLGIPAGPVLKAFLASA